MARGRRALRALALLLVSALLLLGAMPATASDDAIAEAVRSSHGHDATTPGATYLVVGVNRTVYVYSLTDKHLVKKESGAQRYGNVCEPFASAQVSVGDTPTLGRGGLAVLKKTGGRWKVVLEGTMFEDDDLRKIGIDKPTWRRLNR